MVDLPEPTSSADEVRRITQEVLSRPEFADARPSWLDRVWDAVLDAIARAIQTVGAGDRGSIIGTAVLLAVAVAAAAVAVRFTRTVRSDPRSDVAVEGQIGRTAAQWRRDADEHAAAGQWRHVVRCRYREVLAELAASGLVEEVAGRTSGEYLRTVAGDVPTARDSFAEVTRRFELAWYGHAATTRDDADAFGAAVERVLLDAGIRRGVGARA